MKKGIIILTCLIIAFISAFLMFKSKGQPTNTTTKETKSKQLEGLEKLDTPIRPNIEPDHVWRFSFKGEIDKKTIQNKVYILNEEKQRVSIEVEVNNNEILVRPPQEGYGKDKAYELFVEKDIKQVDGKNIEPIHFTFITKRDEVAKVKYSDDLIKIKKSDIKRVDGNVIVVKDIKLIDKIKKDSLIILESKDDNQSEIARKVVSVNENKKELQIDTTTPNFEELFEELDLYQEVPITSEHIKLEPIKGLSLSNRSTALMASASEKFLAEEKGKNSTFSFDNVKLDIDGTEFSINGTIDLNDAKSTPDVVIKNKSIKKFHIYLEEKIDSNLSISIKGKKLDAKKTKKWPIASFVSPTPIPGITFEGDLNLFLEVGGSGELKITMEFTSEARTGIKRKDGQFQGYFDKDFNLTDSQIYGEGKFNSESGFNIEGSLSALKVLSAGIGGKLGGYAEGASFVNGNEILSCYTTELGGVGSAEIFLKVFPKLSNWWNKEKEYYVTESMKFYENKQPYDEKNTCKEAKGLIPDQTPIQLDPGEEKEISLKLNVYDHGTTDENSIDIEKKERKNLSVKSKREDVAKAEVTNEGKVRIIANKTPAQINTEIEVSYNDQEIKGEKTVSIPVQIKNYNPNATKGLEGIWRSEKERTYFYKIVEKGPKSIEVSGMALYEIDYTAIVDFTNIQNKVLSGKLDYKSVHPAVIVDSDTGFRLEKLSKDKIQLTTGKDTRILVRASEKAMEEERTLQAGQKPDSNQRPESTGGIKATYDTLNNDSNIVIFSSFETIDDKKAMIFVEQRINNSNGLTSSLAGIIETEALKQSDSTWSFSWTDNNGTKGTGTITIKGEDATLELKSERNSLTEGRGIISHKSQLKKTS